MVYLSAFADEVTADFKGQIRFLKSENLGYIEIRFVNNKNIMDLDQNKLIDIKNILLDNDIGVSAIGSPIGKIRIDEPFEPHLDQFKHTVDLAQLFNAPFIRIFSYYPPEGCRIDDYRDEIVDRMQRKVDIVRGTNVIIVHENESGIYGRSALNCLDMARTVNSPAFRLVYDPANFVWGQKINNNMETCWPLLKPYVTHIHIKDWNLDSDEVGAMPGTGDGQIKELLTELVASGYDGFLTMEPHLRSGGQFGGDTGPELFSEAIRATRILCSGVGLKCQ